LTKFADIRDELKTVFAGRGGGILDAVLPLIVFLLVTRFSHLEAGIWSAAGVGLLFFVIRLYRGQKIAYALVGLGGVGLAAAASYLTGGEEGFFLPGLFGGVLTVAALLVSAVFKKPLAAYSSHLTRNWPLDWYWHSRVLPAYTQVTLIWAFGFGIRTAIEIWLYIAGRTISLGLIRTLMGWPYTILILILSYFYGIWQLKRLEGPSVDEFTAGAEEPWEGQKRGF
jgi:hypothetical protein